MSLFDRVAENYNIADREFTLKLTGAEVLCLISLVQLGYATAPSNKFQENFPEAIEVAKGLIEVVYEVDQKSGEQLRSGWGL